MHDVNGHPLKVGDKVLIPGRIVSLSEGTPDYCNVTVETTLGRKPDGAKERFSALNTAQIVKVSSDEIALGL